MFGESRDYHGLELGLHKEVVIEFSFSRTKINQLMEIHKF